MFTERDALVQRERQTDLFREAERERFARSADQRNTDGQRSFIYRLGRTLEAIGHRLQTVDDHEVASHGSTTAKAAYER